MKIDTNIIEKTGYFSLSYCNEEWDCSFIHPISEIGACYAETAELAIKGAFEYIKDKSIEEIKELQRRINESIVL